MKLNRALASLFLITILTACASAPEVMVTRAPSPIYPDVTANKPIPPNEQGTVGTCSAQNGKVGRSYVVRGVRYIPKRDPDYRAEGLASFYGKNHHGNQTANGERFNMYAYSAAHTTLPLPSCVRVTNLKNNKAVVLRVNDRGPFIKGRIIDVSYAAAKELGFLSAGLTEVRVEVIN